MHSILILNEESKLKRNLTDIQAQHMVEPLVHLMHKVHYVSLAADNVMQGSYSCTRLSVCAVLYTS